MANSKRLAFFLPNAFTALNMACGFSSISFAFKQHYFEASMLLILGAIFDSVDGRVARLTGTQSSFGEQFDSMSDVVSFGVAPSILIYLKYLNQFGRIGGVVSFIFLLCGALRLARFNANIEKVSSAFFQGLPIPGAALAIIGYVLLADRFPIIDNYPVVALFYTLVYGILMVTTIPFTSFKDSEFVKKHKRMSLLILFVFSALTFSYYKIMFASFMAIYVILSIVYYLKRRRDFGDVFDWSDN